MKARPLVGVFFILLLLHNPQGGQIPVLCNSNDHNQICLKFLPQAVNGNNASWRSLFRECAPFSVPSAGVSHSKGV